MKLAAALTFTALAASSLQAGLVHQYDFTSGVTDLVGSANGSLNGGAVVAGGFLTVDGQFGSYAQFGSHIIPTSGDSTVALDFQSLGAQSGTVELISQGFTTQGYFIGINGGGDFRATDFWVFSGVTFPTDSAWHKLALVSDSAAQTLTLYLDGTAIGSSLLGAPLTTTTGGTTTRLGAQFSLVGIPDSENFLGNIDNVRIYDNALTSGEASALTATPEPSGFILMGLGGIALVRLRSRK